MPVITRPEEFTVNDLYLDLEPVFGSGLYLKCEGFNFAGSIKLKAAAAMVAAAERAGRLRPDSVLVESSSGNLGVALAMIAAGRGLAFRCVTDLRCNLGTRRLMEKFGAQVQVVTEPDPETGLLGARIATVKALCAADPRYVWLDQYTNPGNWLAHYQQTAPAIAAQFPSVGVVFIGAGTSGTLMGCARWFRDAGRPVTIVAIDSEGSAIFGTPAGRRMIPGLGSGVKPPLLDTSYVDHVVHVSEPDTIRTCHRLAAAGFLFGGSTGTVVTGALRWLAAHPLPAGASAVAIAPDLGERYLDTLYQDAWVRDVFGEDLLTTADARPLGEDES